MQNSSLVFHHHTARENGKTTWVATDARDCVPRHRARESARDAIFVFFLASIGGLFSRATWTDPRIFALSLDDGVSSSSSSSSSPHNMHTQNQRKEKKQKKRPTTRIKSERTLPSRRLGFSTLSPVSRSRVSSARNSFASSGRRLSRRRQQRRT